MNGLPNISVPAKLRMRIRHPSHLERFQSLLREKGFKEVENGVYVTSENRVVYWSPLLRTIIPGNIFCSIEDVQAYMRSHSLIQLYCGQDIDDSIAESSKKDYNFQETQQRASFSSCDGSSWESHPSNFSVNHPIKYATETSKMDLEHFGRMTISDKNDDALDMEMSWYDALLENKSVRSFC